MGLNLRVISFEQVNRGKLNEKQVQDYKVTIDHMKQPLMDIVGDPQGYMLMFFLVLLNTTGCTPNSFSSWTYTVQKKIFTLLQRHLAKNNFSRDITDNDFSLLRSKLVNMAHLLPAMTMISPESHK